VLKCPVYRVMLLISGVVVVSPSIIFHIERYTTKPFNLP